MMRSSFCHRLIASTVLAVILCTGIALAATPAQAAPVRSIAAHVRNTAYDTNSHVTIIVLDMSGSMAQNDPQGLRCSAANAYIDLSGPGNFIGLVGLDNNDGKTGGPHNFVLSQIWAQPTEMATLRERQALQQTIVQKSNNCRPDAFTPTYDALNQALTMLGNATDSGKIGGSVILLTDGTPCGNNDCTDTVPQIDAIKADLIPQFQQHGWPIDTVALGPDGTIPGGSGTFHDFLSGLSSATTGNFYDDGHGAVSGISPLNIAPFFVDIFGKRNKRTVTVNIPPTQLDGGTTDRNFDVTDYTNNLDVIVVKDQAQTTAALRTPDGHLVSQSGGGVFISSSDPHYVIFSIDQPQPGTWELDVSGSGQFLMDSLKTSSIGVSTPRVTLQGVSTLTGAALPLGQPIVVTASLTSNGQPVTDQSFTLTGTLTYTGAERQNVPQQNFSMDDKTTPGTYTASLTIAATAPPGSYDILVNASTVSQSAIVASAQTTISAQRFPLPFFLSPQNRQPTEETVNSTVIQWPLPLQLLYSLPIINKLSDWPLQHLPARPYASLSGEVELQGKLYNNANVTGYAQRDGSKNTIAATVVNDGNGRFHVLFPPSAAGDYSVTFMTGGSFADSHGYFGTTVRKVHLAIVPATLSMDLIALGVTLIYLACLLFIIYFLRFCVTPGPCGEWVRLQNGDIVGRRSFKLARRGPTQGFFRRNIIRSRQVNMPKGLLIRFKHGCGIEVQPDGRFGRNWRQADGSDLHPQFLEVSELQYRPVDEADEDDEPSNYLIIAQSTKKPSYQETSYDEDAGSSRKDRRASRRSYDYDYEDDEDRPSRTRRQTESKRRRRTSAEDEDDW